MKLGPVHVIERPPKRKGANGAANAISAEGGDGTWIKFWGVRGSIPSPGPDTVHYGGNTSCVEVRVGSNIIVLDAGSGIRALGRALQKEFAGRPVKINLLVTHTHWDHIQGFPFFISAYDPQNEIAIFGHEGASVGLHHMLSSQMESPFFPVALDQMPGNVVIREMAGPSFEVGGVTVQAKRMNHPGVCNGYRLETAGGAITYMPDVELSPKFRHAADECDLSAAELELVDFARDSEALILDAQYDAAEHILHAGWGHSCMEDSVALAALAGVKRLFLFHHDPDHSDQKIAALLAQARKLAADRRPGLMVEAAAEGRTLSLPAKPADS